MRTMRMLAVGLALAATAHADGSFEVTNSRNGFSRRYER